MDIYLHHLHKRKKQSIFDSNSETKIVFFKRKSGKGNKNNKCTQYIKDSCYHSSLFNLKKIDISFFSRVRNLPFQLYILYTYKISEENYILKY